MQPEIKKIKEIMQIHEYQRIPVYQEMLADQITPVAAMQRLCAHSQHCYLLESASQDGSRGRYSFLGYHPQMEITCQNGLMTIRQKHAGGGEIQCLFSQASWRHAKKDHQKLSQSRYERTATVYWRSGRLLCLRLSEIQRTQAEPCRE